MMTDSFFGFDTEFPSGLSVLGRRVVEDELLTDDVEEEYNALNDETFGHAANDDWEEAHEKLSELDKSKKSHQSVFHDSLLEGDESQNEIVSKSISQLGLEDDLDDPAIMTVGRTHHSSGSPKTHSIWSTTPKDSGINSLLQSHSDCHQEFSPPTFALETSGAYTSPLRSAWRVEELERDLLSNSNREQGRTQSSCDWPNHFSRPNQQDKINLSVQRLPVLSNRQTNVSAISGRELMMTRDAVERHLHSDQRSCFPSKMSNYGSPFTSSHLRPNILSPVGPASGNNLTGPLQSSPVIPLRTGRGGTMLGGNRPVPNSPFLPYAYGVNPRMNNMMTNHNQVPLRSSSMPNLPPGFNLSCMNRPQYNPQIHNILNSRIVDYPSMHKQFSFPMVFHNKRSDVEYHKTANQWNEDEYAGLMTQKEKDWLIRIQLLLLKTDNPYVEDYYFTTQVTRRCRKKFSENALNGGGDGPQLVLPERSKSESRAYVPTQFEGSLGKLQAVSVNFPRKVLDITVSRTLEDEEGKIVTNQSLMKYRRLLLDIEKLYSSLLEIDDEERRILALPDGADEPHRQTISKLTKKIFSGLSCESAISDDVFQNIMTIRKGRNLVVRAFKVFNKDQQLQCVNAIFRCLPMILRKDQNDLILVHNCELFIAAIKKFSLPDLVLLGESLKNNSSSEIASASSKEQSNFISAFKNKFGSSVICTMFQQAESLYSGYELFEVDIQARWAKVVLHAVDCICALIDSSISSPVVPCLELLAHFQRFPVDRDKFEILNEKVKLLEETDPKGGGETV